MKFHLSNATMAFILTGIILLWMGNLTPALWMFGLGILTGILTMIKIKL
jgi:hypothetical protein